MIDLPEMRGGKDILNIVCDAFIWKEFLLHQLFQLFVESCCAVLSSSTLYLSFKKFRGNISEEPLILIWIYMDTISTVDLLKKVFISENMFIRKMQKSYSLGSSPVLKCISSGAVLSPHLSTFRKRMNSFLFHQAFLFWASWHWV